MTVLPTVPPKLDQRDGWIPGSKFSNKLRPTTLKLNVFDCETPLVWFVNQMMALVVPSGKFVALLLTVTEIVAPEFAFNVPFVGETVIQPALLTRFHVRLFALELVMMKNAGLGVNGPPTG